MFDSTTCRRVGAGTTFDDVNHPVDALLVAVVAVTAHSATVTRMLFNDRLSFRELRHLDIKQGNLFMSHRLLGIELRARASAQDFLAQKGKLYLQRF